MMKNCNSITIKSYDKTVKEYTAHVANLHPLKDSKKFLSLLPKKAKILDLGCGSGRDAKIFADKGFNIVGIDLSREMIASAKKKVKNAEFEVMNILRLKFKENIFDGVWANASLLHIPKKDIAKVIKAIYRSLKENGIFYSSLKEGDGEALLPDERYRGVKKFWAFYKEAELKKLFTDAGFRILESYVIKKRHSYATHPRISIFSRK